MIKARNASGDSAYSSSVTTFTLPATPANLKAFLVQSDNSTLQAHVSWGAVSGASEYRIYFNTTSGVNSTHTLTTVMAPDANVTVPGLTIGNSYYFAVSAFNSSGETTLSSEVAAFLMPLVSIVGGSVNRIAESDVLTVNNDYKMAKYPVTQGLWEAVMGIDSWPGTVPDNTYGRSDDHPMYFVSWDDITQENGFLDKLNEAVGCAAVTTRIAGATRYDPVDFPEGCYRLPTADESEYAHRSGTGTLHYWGDGETLDDVDPFAWYYDNSHILGSGHPDYGAQPVGAKLPNIWGLYDMSGSVWEWVYTQSGSNRVIRSGSWYDYASSLRSAFRSDLLTSDTSFNLGFRLVLEAGALNLSIPAAPVNLSTLFGNGQVTVSWDGVEGAGSYRVYYDTGSPVSTGSSFKFAVGNEITITGLTNGTKYYFRVVSVNSAGTSVLSTEVYTVPSPHLDMVEIVAGTVNCTTENCGNGTGTITVNKDYKIGKYPVTQGLWEEIMGIGSWPGSGDEVPNISRGLSYDRPMYYVSWNDITQENGFLDKLNAAIGCTAITTRTAGSDRYNPVDFPEGCYRLPTADESEYAHRSGTTGTYYWGESGDFAVVDQYAWYHDNTYALGFGQPGYGIRPVGGKLPNSWGLYDMSGNVSEWTYTDSGLNRVMRGGDWPGAVSGLRSAFRDFVDPGSQQSDCLGFRLVLETGTLSTAAPGTPANVKAVFGEGQATVSWDEVEGVGAYHVYYDTGTPVSTGSNFELAAGNDITIIGLTNGTKYFFRVVAVNSAGMSALSTEVSVIPLPYLEMVNIVAGTVNCTTENCGNGTTSLTITDDFKVGRYLVTQGLWEAVMGAESWPGISPQTPSSTYGRGDDYPMYYVSWNDVTQANGFLDKLNDSIGCTAITTRTAGATRYDPVDFPEGCYRLPTADESEYAHRSGTETRHYWGDSDEDNVVKSYAWYDKNANVDFWTEPHADNNGIQPVGQKIPNRWGLYDASGNVWEWTYTPSDINRTITGGSWYYDAATMRSANRFYNPQTERYVSIGFRLVLETGTLNLSAPAIPQNLNVESGEGQAALSWDMVNGADSYVVSYKTTDSVTWNESIGHLENSVNLYALLEGTAYEFMVKACNSSGDSAYSSMVTTTTLPAVPVNLTAVGGNMQVDLSWDMVTGADSYVISHKTTESATWIESSEQSETFLTLSGLLEGNAYEFMVKARNTSGDSAYSAVVTTFTLLNAPSGIVAEGGDSLVSVGWDEVTGADFYRVYYGEQENLSLENYDDFVELNSYSLGAIISPLHNGRTYYFAVQALNSNEASPLSVVKKVATLDFLTVGSGFNIDMVRIPAGSVYRVDEGTTVTVDADFYLGQFEVTQGQWETVMTTSNPVWPGSLPSETYGMSSSHPAYYISWDDITGNSGFLDVLNASVGCTGLITDGGEVRYDPINVPAGCFRLPAANEAEYAQRAGSEDLHYWGDDETEEVAKQYAWYMQNADSGYWTEPHAMNSGTQPVGGKLPNFWSLFDMSGNAWEWNYDLYAGADFVLRGGGWENDVFNIRSAFYTARPRDYRSYEVGFRLVYVPLLPPQNVNAFWSDYEEYQVSWDAVSGATGYRVYYGESAEIFKSVSDTYISVVETEQLSSTISGLAAGKTYYFGVTALNSVSESAISTLVNPLEGQKESVISTNNVLMVRIPAGTVNCTQANCSNGLSSITIGEDFYLGKFPVTQGLWEAVTSSNPSYFSTCGADCPVEQVLWSDITQENGFLDSLNAMTGCTDLYAVPGADRYNPVNVPPGCFRLPGLSESEYANRAGRETLYYWGNTLAAGQLDLYADLYAWYTYNSGNMTHPVGQKLPNDWGLYDINGNVQEWLYDFDGTTNRIRGGGYHDGTGGELLLSWTWGWGAATHTGLGFRLARTVSLPLNLVVTGDITEISLSWDSLSGASVYRLAYSTAGLGEWLYSNWFSEISTSISELVTGVDYNFRIQAMDGSNNNLGFSDTLTFKQELTAPVELSSATVGDGQIMVSWQAVEGAASYSVYYSDVSPVIVGGSGVSSISTDGEIFINTTQAVLDLGTTYPFKEAYISGLNAGTPYFFRVAALNAGGTVGLLSAETQAVPSTFAIELVRLPAMAGNDFYMGKYTVTQGLWEAVMGNNPSNFLTCGSTCPVEMVYWGDITGTDGFLDKLNLAVGCVGLISGTERYASANVPGGCFRLPTSAEFEYAQRAGSSSTFYWGESTSHSDIDLYAWYSGNNSPVGTKAVGQKFSNAWGLYDMSGNVWQWMYDGYKFRGGTYGLSYSQLSSSYSNYGSSSSAGQDLGFRIIYVPHQ
jgi:formylglycine-generating enzyme required for sulfatase activity